jgi:uncharacterized protein (DUF58 family)
MTDTDTQSRLSRTATSTGTRTRAQTVTRVSNAPTGLAARTAFRGRVAAMRAARGIGVAAGWVRDTVTAAGWLVVGAAVLGLVAGFAVGWAVGWVVGIAAAVLLVACVPFLLGGHDYGVRLELDRERVVAGTEVGGRLEIVNRAARLALPGTIDVPVGTGLVEAHVPLLRAGAKHVEQLTISARRRGVIQVGPMTISRGDPIGVLRRELSWPDVQTVFVHPVTTAIPSTSAGLVRDLEGMPSSDIVASDLSFHAIREYVTGDSQRHVHWKSTAKTGRLMVRQYEETRRSRLAILLGIADDEYADDDEFEMSVSAAASLGRQGIRDGREVLVAASAEIPELVRGTVLSVRELNTLTEKAMLDGFSEVEIAERATRLEDVSSIVAQANPELSIAFLVTGSLLPLNRLRSASLKFPANISTVAVRCEPGAEPTLRSAGSLSVMTLGHLDDLKNMMARGAIR